jgi:hypothetical protein
MEYVKQHVANSWETELTLIQAQINDTKAILNTLTAQASEAETRKTSAETLLDLLDDTRVNQQERQALKRLISKSSVILDGIGKQNTRVQARLTQWETRLESFPHAELIKERKIRNTRSKAGSLLIQQEPSRFEKTLAFE